MQRSVYNSRQRPLGACGRSIPASERVSLGIGRVEGERGAGLAAGVVGAAEELGAQGGAVGVVGEGAGGRRDDAVEVGRRRLPAAPDVEGLAGVGAGRRAAACPSLPIKSSSWACVRSCAPRKSANWAGDARFDAPAQFEFRKSATQPEVRPLQPRRRGRPLQPRPPRSAPSSRASLRSAPSSRAPLRSAPSSRASLRSAPSSRAPLRSAPSSRAPRGPPPPAAPAEVRPLQPRLAEVRPLQPRPEVRPPAAPRGSPPPAAPAEVRPLQPRLAEVRPLQPRPAEVRPLQPRPARSAPTSVTFGPMRGAGRGPRGRAWGDWRWRCRAPRSSRVGSARRGRRRRRRRCSAGVDPVRRAPVARSAALAGSGRSGSGRWSQTAISRPSRWHQVSRKACRAVSRARQPSGRSTISTLASRRRRPDGRAVREAVLTAASVERAERLWSRRADRSSTQSRAASARADTARTIRRIAAPADASRQGRGGAGRARRGRCASW